MTTPAKSLTTLEYDKIIARLAALCQTARGRALALALEPSPEYAEVLHRQRLTAEGRRMGEMKPNAGLSGVRDIGTLVHQASLGHALEPAELLDVLRPSCRPSVWSTTTRSPASATTRCEREHGIITVVPDAEVGTRLVKVLR